MFKASVTCRDNPVACVPVNVMTYIGASCLVWHCAVWLKLMSSRRFAWIYLNTIYMNVNVPASRVGIDGCVSYVYEWAKVTLYLVRGIVLSTSS